MLDFGWVLFALVFGASLCSFILGSNTHGSATVCTSLLIEIYMWTLIYTM